jgi:hypothetical protein
MFKCLNFLNSDSWQPVYFLCGLSAPGEGEGIGQKTDSESGHGMILFYPIV